jgi:hypothetical protein
LFEGINEVPEEETDSCSNEDSDSLLSVSMNGNYSAVPLYVHPVSRPRSLSYEEPNVRNGSDSMVGLDDSYFEIILQKNIELWKSAAKEEKIKLFENELIT